tara:strand:+ start:2947 stop:3486 length:540 start_codon:yes stop_codon:yes gene_type:complete
MKRKLSTAVLILAVIVGGIVGVQQYQLYQTKQYSPAEIASYSNNAINIEVTYSRPFKKDREIFGKLVPYGKWWRTGANEATTIQLSRDVSFSGKTLKAGLYSLVTIPGETEWQIIFNNQIHDWGTVYTPEDDELRVTAKVEELPEVVEQFTIDFSEENGGPVLIMAWDKTKVSTPFKVL